MENTRSSHQPPAKALVEAGGNRPELGQWQSCEQRAPGLSSHVRQSVVALGRLPFSVDKFKSLRCKVHARSSKKVEFCFALF